MKLFIFASQLNVKSLHLGYKIQNLLPLPADTDDVDPDGVQLLLLLLRLQLQLPVDEKGYHQQEQQKL